MKGKTYFVPFEPEHLDQFEALDLYKAHPYKEIYREAYQSQGVYFHTLLDAKTLLPIAIMGFILIFPRAASVWCITGKKALRMPKEYGKQCRSLIDFYFKKKAVVRAEVYIPVEFKWAMSWGHFLGFKLEGVCENYGFEEKPHYLMSRVV